MYERGGKVNKSSTHFLSVLCSTQITESFESTEDQVFRSMASLNLAETTLKSQKCLSMLQSFLFALISECHITLLQLRLLFIKEIK